MIQIANSCKQFVEQTAYKGGRGEFRGREEITAYKSFATTNEQQGEATEGEGEKGFQLQIQIAIVFVLPLFSSLSLSVAHASSV